MKKFQVQQMPTIREILEALSTLQILPYDFSLCFGFELTYALAAADPREAAPVN